jgi:hypothetical protein
MEFSASAQDTHSSASPSTRAVWSSVSLIRRVALSRATMASQVDVLAASTAAARTASVTTMTSCAQATSGCRTVTSALP